MFLYQTLLDYILTYISKLLSYKMLCSTHQPVKNL